jgi:hypothetical protein
MILLLAACSSAAHASSVPRSPATVNAPTASTTTAPARPRHLSARFNLSSDNVVADSSITARLIVDNPGAALHATGPCGLPFAIVLANKAAQQQGLFNDCGERHTIPTGRTVYRLTAFTRYSACVNNRADGPLPLCTGDGKIPPLPPGNYHATLADALHVLPKLASQPLRIDADPTAVP